MAKHYVRSPEKIGLIMMYSCGLRVSEAIRLKAEDVAGRRMAVCVRSGKGDKHRNVPLPSRTLDLLSEVLASATRRKNS